MATKIKYLNGIVEEYQLLRQVIRDAKSHIDAALRLTIAIPDETINKGSVQFELFRALDAIKEVDDEV